MRKISYFLVLALLSSQAWATYIVVLKNGTRYRAKDRWTMSNGKAIVQLENGTTLQIEPNLIDIPASEQATRSGYGDAKVLTTPEGAQPTTTPKPSLGEITRIRRQQQQQQGIQPGGTTATVPPVTTAYVTGPGALGADVTSRFVGAYENVGFYDAKVTNPSAYTVRVQLTTDNEDQVFKALSATSYMMRRVPALTNTRIDTVELFMGMVNGGTAGRFLMSQDDARAIDEKALTIESFFVRKVIF
jgi:hypothetical protein